MYHLNIYKNNRFIKTLSTSTTGQLEDLKETLYALNYQFEICYSDGLNIEKLTFEDYENLIESVKKRLI